MATSHGRQEGRLQTSGQRILHLLYFIKRLRVAPTTGTALPTHCPHQPTRQPKRTTPDGCLTRTHPGPGAALAAPGAAPCEEEGAPRRSCHGCPPQATGPGQSRLTAQLQSWLCCWTPAGGAEAWPALGLCPVLRVLVGVSWRHGVGWTQVSMMHEGCSATRGGGGDRAEPRVPAPVAPSVGCASAAELRLHGSSLGVAAPPILSCPNRQPRPTEAQRGLDAGGRGVQLTCSGLKNPLDSPF